MKAKGKKYGFRTSAGTGAANGSNRKSRSDLDRPHSRSERGETRRGNRTCRHSVILHESLQKRRCCCAVRAGAPLAEACHLGERSAGFDPQMPVFLRSPCTLCGDKPRLDRPRLGKSANFVCLCARLAPLCGDKPRLDRPRLGKSANFVCFCARLALSLS